MMPISKQQTTVSKEIHLVDSSLTEDELSQDLKLRIKNIYQLMA